MMNWLFVIRFWTLVLNLNHRSPPSSLSSPALHTAIDAQLDVQLLSTTPSTPFTRVRPSARHVSFPDRRRSHFQTSGAPFSANSEQLQHSTLCLLSEEHCCE